MGVFFTEVQIKSTSHIPLKKMKVCKKAFLVLKLDPDFSSIKDS